jgi:hypothetical protein
MMPPLADFSPILIPKASDCRGVGWLEGPVKLKGGILDLGVLLIVLTVRLKRLKGLKSLKGSLQLVTSLHSI